MENDEGQALSNHEMGSIICKVESPTSYIMYDQLLPLSSARFYEDVLRHRQIILFYMIAKTGREKWAEG